MLLIDIRNALARNRLTWTLLGFVGLWFTTYFWLWRSESGPGLRHLSKSSDRFRRNGSNKDYINQTAFIMDTPAGPTEPKGQEVVKIMTWNLQGLMADDLGERTEAVISVIKRESPDAVFFQELIPSTYETLSQSLRHNYSPVSGSGTTYSGYFTGIFYKKHRFRMKHHEVQKFSNSVMDRNLLIVKIFDAAKPKLKLALMTSHLESLPRFKKSRLEQLQQSFLLFKSLHEKYNVVFGGDLNLQSGEEEGLVPDDIKDVWQECGSSEILKYTWDMRTNRNEQVPGVSIEEQPRERYDRLYFRSSTPKSLELRALKLLGQEVVEGTLYFPSDHWALMSTFQLTEEAITKNNVSVCNIG